MAQTPWSGVLSQLESDMIQSVVSLPPSLGHVVSASLGLQPGGVTGRQVGGGCNDAYSAFAFLSFLFALLTFIQNNAGGGRRRRAAGEKVGLMRGM